jgi:hypothetical protein
MQTEGRRPIWRRYEIYFDKRALIAGLISAALYALQLLRS